MTRHRPGPPAGQLMRVGGHMVHVHDSGSGPAVVLLHGAGGNLRDFTLSIQPALAQDHRVLALDRPGLGLSDRLHDKGETPLEQARHLDGALDALGVGRAVILGHSFGGAVALAWAVANPGRVAGLVVLSGASMPWPGSAALRYTLVGNPVIGAVLAPAIARALPRRALDRIAAEIFAPQKPPEGYLDAIDIALTLRPAALRANARQIGRLKATLRALAGSYPALTCPVEIVHGTADQVVPMDVHARPLARRLANAALTELPGIGHMPHHAAPEAVRAAINRARDRA